MGPHPLYVFKLACKHATVPHGIVRVYFALAICIRPARLYDQPLWLTDCLEISGRGTNNRSLVSHATNLSSRPVKE